jgi:flavodoxin
MNVLIIYYSLTGNTEKVANAIEVATNATKVKLHETSSRSGLVGIFRMVYQAIFSRPSKINYIETDITQYDLLILGGPVWIAKLAPALRSYILKERKNFKEVAFFCTESSSGGANVFKCMENLCGKHPIATLEVTESEIKTGRHNNKINVFVESLKSH